MASESSRHQLAEIFSRTFVTRKFFLNLNRIGRKLGLSAHMPVGKGRKLIDPKEGDLSPAPALTKTGCAVSKYAVKPRTDRQTDIPSKLLAPKIEHNSGPGACGYKGRLLRQTKARRGSIDVNQRFAKALPIVGQLDNQLLTTTQFWKIRVRRGGNGRGANCEI